MENSKVSVILPCKNGSKYLNETLISINKQTIPLELIFIDDGSTDESLSIFQNFKFNSLIQTKYISRESKGFSKSLSEGIELASTNYIARIDSDDVWFSNHLEMIVTEFQNDEKLVLVGSQAIIINEKSDEIGFYEVPIADYDLRKYLLKDSPFIHSSVVFRLDKYKLTCGYCCFNELEIVTDYNLWFEFSKIGEIKNFSVPTIYYRKLKNSMSRDLKLIENYKARLLIMEKASKYYFPKFYFYSFYNRTKCKLRILSIKLISKLTNR